MVLLDRGGPSPGPGLSPTGCRLLNLTDTEQGLSCRQTGHAADRQLDLVSSSGWFSPSCSSDRRRSLVSSFVVASCPGPHVFLLCVPINQPMDGEDKALDAMCRLFGPTSVSEHTLVVFTNLEELEEDEQLDQYLLTWRKDLQQLVDRCRGRYLTLESPGGGAETGRGELQERQAVEELMEKVEQMVKESEAEYVGCGLYEEAELRVRQRQVELVRQGKGVEPTETVLEEEETELESVRDDAVQSVGDLHFNLDDVFPPISGSAPSRLCLMWVKLCDWLRWLPRLVRREALLGAIVGMFVGGPFGGVLGATVGSVATEVGRRKTKKL